MMVCGQEVKEGDIIRFKRNLIFKKQVIYGKVKALYPKNTGKLLLDDIQLDNYAWYQSTELKECEVLIPSQPKNLIGDQIFGIMVSYNRATDEIDWLTKLKGADTGEISMILGQLKVAERQIIDHLEFGHLPIEESDDDE